MPGVFQPPPLVGTFTCVAAPGNRRPHLLAALQDNTVGLSKFAGPGGFNDPDMLEVRLERMLYFHIGPCARLTTRVLHGSVHSLIRKR